MHNSEVLCYMRQGVFRRIYELLLEDKIITHDQVCRRVRLQTLLSSTGLALMHSAVSACVACLI